jgi:PEP-CTERM motif-containing protein
MKRQLRTLSFALAVAAAATTAGAQQSQANPAARGDRDSFYYGTIHGAPRSDPLGSPLTPQQGIGRPVGRYGPVTPVPEPSEWAMMLAGLAVVGWMVRRNSKRS